MTQAEDNLEIAYQFKSSGVIGIDFCGNPSTGYFRQFRPLFERARELGLKTTVHCAEINNPEDTDEIIDFKPDRLGHAAVLNKNQIEKIIENKIPVEVCLSSNMTTKACERISDHPVKYWIKENHPFCLCTDDISLFNSELHEEWTLLQRELKISDQNIKHLIRDSSKLYFNH